LRPDLRAPLSSTALSNGTTETEFFNGGHTINGSGTFRFLENHLKWPGGQ
jgi:hypothetical protein